MAPFFRSKSKHPIGLSVPVRVTLVLMLVMAVGCTENSRENTMSFTGGEDAGATATPPMATDDGDASTATSSDASQSQRDAIAEVDFLDSMAVLKSQT